MNKDNLIILMNTYRIGYMDINQLFAYNIEDNERINFQISNKPLRDNILEGKKQNGK